MDSNEFMTHREEDLTAQLEVMRRTRDLVMERLSEFDQKCCVLSKELYATTKELMPLRRLADEVRRCLPHMTEEPMGYCMGASERDELLRLLAELH